MCEEANIMMRFIISGHQMCIMVYRDTEYYDLVLIAVNDFTWLQYLTVQCQ